MPSQTSRISLLSIHRFYFRIITPPNICFKFASTTKANTLHSTLRQALLYRSSCIKSSLLLRTWMNKYDYHPRFTDGEPRHREVEWLALGHPAIKQQSQIQTQDTWLQGPHSPQPDYTMWQWQVLVTSMCQCVCICKACQVKSDTVGDAMKCL